MLDTVAVFTIDPDNGCIGIAGAVALTPGHARSELGPVVTDRLGGVRKYGGGHEWLDLRGLSFGGQPSSLALCFRGGRLEQASWSVHLPDAMLVGSWPSRAAIDAEVAFVRRTLSEEMGLQLGRTPWGEIWSHFDARGFTAASGLRYRFSS